MHLRVLLLLLATALIVGAAPAAPQKVFPLQYDQYDMENGLRVVTIPTDYPNVVAVYIVVSVGSRNEVEPGKTGFAHFFEHMMFRGTKLYPPERYEATLKKIGADSNAYTSDDLTVYHTVFSKEDLPTVMEMESDRFQNLDYAESAFRTEALAVLGEYNKNSAAPTSKLHEKVRETTFTNHTYKHTTMGFLADVQDMPNQFAYSKQFFDRFYRPEYTTVLIVGDVKTAETRALANKYWGAWKRGNYKADIPKEPPQTEPRTARVDWPSPTLPWIVLAYQGPAYSDTEKDAAALDLMSAIGFSESSPLYQKLVIEEQKVDVLSAGVSDHVDPYTFDVSVRLKNPAEMETVRKEIHSTLNGFRENLVDAQKLDRVKRNLRYSFVMRMDNSKAIAEVVARFLALRRTPETINTLYNLYASITPEDIRSAAKKYITDKTLTTVTLTGGKAR